MRRVVCICIAFLLSRCTYTELAYRGVRHQVLQAVPGPDGLCFVWVKEKDLGKKKVECPKKVAEAKK